MTAFSLDLHDFGKELEFVTAAHAHQTYGEGRPYDDHLKEVFQAVIDLGFATERVILEAALIHDVFEDTQYTPDCLEKIGFSPEAINIALGVTRNKDNGLTYLQWIHQISKLDDIRIVKLKYADNFANASPSSTHQIKDSVKRRKYMAMAQKRYIPSMAILSTRLNAEGIYPVMHIEKDNKVLA